MNRGVRGNNCRIGLPVLVYTCAERTARSRRLICIFTQLALRAARCFHIERRIDELLMSHPLVGFSVAEYVCGVGVFLCD